VKPLGRIVRLQIQRSSLKLGEKGHRVYDPAPLLAVGELTLTAAGASGRAGDGSFTLDIHNSAHPYTKNGGPNPLSVVFTRHYSEMRARFGDHLTTGCAGENMLVECGDLIRPGDVADGIAIETSRGRVVLGKVIVAEPCSSFGRFALGRQDAAADEVKESLQFLGRGMRGYYCELASGAPATVMIGDQVVAL
jgi:hypothetical protein